MKVAIDTSALVKRYVAIQGGAELQQIFEQATSVHIAHHCRVEMHSAFNRMRLTKQISAAACRGAIAAFERDLPDYEVAPWIPEIEARAITLLVGSNLRAMDALHISAAVNANADWFVTSDERQSESAVKAGLIHLFVR
ncbi:MAG TPA: type II toxin-antitoxin system VapC family toxin [Casimicrobium sp.]|nr:type II toxin-antitoxin system VapC family toxin [Casimicrobium sp.]